MNTFEEILYLLQGKMEEPQPWGWFHFMWLFLVAVASIILYINRKKYSEKQLKWVLGVYGIGALILEVIKQLIWSFNFDAATNIITWDYQWYAAPFQLCSTPIFVTVACLFLKTGKVRSALLAYVAYTTILGSIATMLIPTDCFTDFTEVNIHTMWLHCGSFVVSLYLLMTGAVKDNKSDLFGAFISFGAFATVANVMNIVLYNSGILNGETFDMFYISPYFISALPVFDKIQENVPYLIFLLTYVVVILGGTLLIFGLNKLVRRIRRVA